MKNNILFHRTKIFWFLTPGRFVTPMFWKYMLPLSSVWQTDVQVDVEVQCHLQLSKPQKISISSSTYRETLRLIFILCRLSSLLPVLQPNGCYWFSTFLTESMFMINTSLGTAIASSKYICISKSSGKVYPSTGHERPKRQLSYCFCKLNASLGWVVNTTPRPPYPRGRRVGTHCRGGWVGPRAGLDGFGKSRIRSPDRSARSESLYRLRSPGPLCVSTVCIYMYYKFIKDEVGKRCSTHG